MATRSMPTVSCLFISAGDLELAADAVGAGDEDGMLVAAAEEPGVRVEVEEAGEAAGPLASLARRERRRDDAERVVGAGEERLDAGDRLLVLLEVEPGFLVIPLLGHRGYPMLDGRPLEDFLSGLTRFSPSRYSPRLIVSPTKDGWR